MAHSDAVADRDGIELEGGAASVGDSFFDNFSDFFEVYMAGNDIATAVCDADKGFFYVLTV